MPERYAERRPIQPELIVYCGPMFSGKSDELIKELKRAPHAKYKVIAFYPEIDNRRDPGTINSENSGKYPATPVKKSREILDLVTPEIDIVGIDEAQFMDDEILDVCLTLVSRGKKVIVAGLDKNFRGEPFGPMARLKQEADHTETFHAYCAVCGESASFTQRIIDGKPANYNDPEVKVGADEFYQARCRKHHEVPGKPGTNSYGS
jgi:thymidine kinase